MNLIKALNPLPLILILTIGGSSFAQQRRGTRTPRRPPATTSSQATNATFDTLLASDRYKIYAEVRNVGQVIRSSSVNELLEPVMKWAAPSKEFKTLVKWLNVHAEEVMTSRLMVATWPMARNVPDLIAVLEFDTPESAAKFSPELSAFLTKVLPTPAPTDAQQKPTESASPASYQLQQVNSLILISPTAVNLKNLRPSGSKLLAESASFRVARGRFTSEQVFIYFDISEVLKQETKNRELAQGLEPTDGLKPTQLPTEEQQSVLSGQVDPNSTPVLSPSPEAEASPEPTPDPLQASLSEAANSFLIAEGTWPDAFAFGVSIENDSLDVKALMVNRPGEKSDLIPFFPNLIAAAPLVPESPSILPADTELFVMLSLDLPQIYAAMAKVQGMTRPEAIAVKGQSTPFAEIENRFKINIKDDLLPLLGSEIVVSMPVKMLEAELSPRGPSPVPSPGSVDVTVNSSEPSFVVALSLRDKEGMKMLLPKLVDAIGFKGASAFAQKERREDTEIISYANTFSYAFISNFLIISADVNAVRHVVDSYLKRETLAADSQFKNYTRWQPQQLQAQVYVSPALMKSYGSWVDQQAAMMSDQLRDFFSRMTLVAQPITYSLMSDGLGTLHELHVPKNLVLMAVAGFSAESNPTPVTANERAVVSSLYLIANAENQFRSGKGAGSFGTLEQLAAEGLIDEKAAEPPGYRINITLEGTKFELTATPLEHGRTGRTSYFINETNVLRGADHGGGIATASDRPIR
jgi:hypothetical protein